MKLQYLVALMAIPSALVGNPIAIGELGDCPLSTENVTVRFAGSQALVDGTYVFDVSARGSGHLFLTIPLVVQSSEDQRKLTSVFKITSSGNFLGIQGTAQFREPMDFEKSLAPGLPRNLKLVIATWQIGSIASTGRSEIAITYRQPLLQGVFYYLPLTRARFVEPEDPLSAQNAGLQAKLIAEEGKEISLATISPGAVWGQSSVTLNLRHRNLIAATQVSRPTVIDRPAPWIEIISGSRRCATHHIELIAVTARVDKEWRNIMTSDLEPFEDCPNAFSWLTDLQGGFGRREIVKVRYESCAKCEESYASRHEREMTNKKRKQNTIDEAYAASSVVFYGYVTKTRVVKEVNNGQVREMLLGTVEVLQAYKGELEKQVEIETPVREIDGNYAFGVGTYHLIYGSGEGPYYMDRFGRSMPAWAASTAVEGKEEFKELEKLSAAQRTTEKTPITDAPAK